MIQPTQRLHSSKRIIVQPSQRSPGKQGIGSLIVQIQGPNRNLNDDSTTNDHGVGSDYLFGIVESVGASGPCEQENSYGCWTGEDCSGNAFITPEGNTINNKCHDVYSVISSEEENKKIEERFEYSRCFFATMGAAINRVP